MVSTSRTTNNVRGAVVRPRTEFDEPTFLAFDLLGQVGAQAGEKWHGKVGM
jgi:hypothetical protein